MEMKHLTPQDLLRPIEGRPFPFSEEGARFYLSFDELDPTFETFFLGPVTEEHEFVPGGLYFSTEEAAKKVAASMMDMYRYAQVSPMSEVMLNCVSE